jgi:chaperonin GroEL (HSP60 family)
VTLIRVGAPSEAEMKNRKDAFEDAIASTKAATAEGIVPGGGMALLRVIGAVQSEEAKCEGDEATGVRILRHALEALARQMPARRGYAHRDRRGTQGTRGTRSGLSDSPIAAGRLGAG